MTGRGFVAVHVGAGYHSPANSELYKQVCKTACHQALEVLKQKKSALDAVTMATMALEDSPWTNAGTGSNLTITGQVECDASVMDGGTLHYGAVGAMSAVAVFSGVKNPICVAENLLKTQMLGSMSLGRIPPSTLVGPGAKEWARKNKLPVCKQEDLLTDASKRAFIKHKRKLDMLEEGGLQLESNKRIIKMEESNSRGDATSDGHDGQLDKSQQNTIPAKKPRLEENTNKNADNMDKQQCESTRQKASVSETKLTQSTDGQTDHKLPQPSATLRKVSNLEPEKTSEPQSHSGIISNQIDISNQSKVIGTKINNQSSLGGCSAGDDMQDKSEDCLLDTVGAICVDENGHVASAVSSGGIVLKQPGRLGQAALFGCGCWAECDRTSGTGFGVSTSGCGEHLTKTLIARECGDAMSKHEDPVSGIAQAFNNKFLNSHFLQNLDQKLGGALCVKSQHSLDKLSVEVIWAHTTDSMCLAYMSTSDKQPKAFISRLPEGKPCGKSFLVQSKRVNIPAE